MTRVIRLDLIEQNYDQMIEFATAIRAGTASAEAVLRRFTRNATHPVYRATLELGRPRGPSSCADTSRDPGGPHPPYGEVRLDTARRLARTDPGPRFADEGAE
jgi:hypothetical protein